MREMMLPLRMHGDSVSLRIFHHILDVIEILDQMLMGFFLATERNDDDESEIKRSIANF